MSPQELSRIRDASRLAYLGWFDALLEKRKDILALSLEELAKLSAIGRAADNNCCNGSTGLGIEEVAR